MKTASFARARFTPARAAALLALLLAPAAYAGPLAERLPQDSLAIAEWAGADALNPQYKGSNLQGIVDSTHLPSLLLKQLTNSLIEGRDGKGLTPGEQALLAALWKYPGAAALLPADFTDFAKGGDLTPRAVYIMNAGPQSAAVAQQITDTLANLKKEQPDMPAITVTHTDTLVIASIGTLTADERAAIDTGKSSIAATEVYTKASANFRKDAALNVLVDAPKLLAAIAEGIAKDADLNDKDRADAKAIIDVLGVGSLTTLTYSAGFDGKEWGEKTLIGMGPDRHGLLALLDLKPLADGILKSIPKDTPSVNIVRLDLDRAFKEFRAALGKIDPDQLKEFDQGVTEANTQIGIDIEKDLLAPLGDTFSIYRLGAAGDQGASFALINPLRDAVAFPATIDKLATLAGTFLKITNETVADSKVWTIEDPQLPIALSVSDGKFIIASRLDLDDVIAQLKGKTSILDRPEFQALQKALPQVAPTSLDFVDLKAVYAQSSAGIKELISAASAQGIEIPPESIPDPDKIAPFLTPGMSITWLDDAGYHLEGRSAFPGAGILGLQQASIAPLSIVGITALLPATVQARQRAKMVAESADEKQLLMGVMMYSADADGKLPEDIAQLYGSLGGDSSALKAFVSPQSSTKPLELTPDQKTAAEKDWKTIQKDLNEHCDFTLAAIGIKMDDISKASPLFILLYPKSTVPVTNGTNLGFADGHVELVKPADLKSRIEQNNDARKTLKLPLLKVDDTGHIVPE